MTKALFSNWKNTLIYLVVIVGLVFSMIRVFKVRKTASNQACETVKMELHGVITEFWGREYSLHLRLDTRKDPIGVTVTKLKLLKGFENGYSYRKGDSVIKSAGSKDITYKRGDGIAVFRLDCSD